MATVNYRLRKVKAEKHPILVYLSMGRNNIIQVKTDFTINPKDWSKSTKRPKQNNSSNKKLFKNLLKLETYIFDQLNESESRGEIINRYWLENVINDCFGRLKKTDKENNLLTYQTQYIIDNANTRKIKSSNKIGLSENTIKGYNTFLNTVLNYEKKLKKEIRLTDINSLFVDGFTNWLMNENNYSINHTGKQLSLLKTVCRDAYKREVKVNPFFSQIQSFSDSKENKYIVTLSFDELETIRNKDISKEYINNVRKWLLIGCEIGQRGGDLLKLTKDNLRHSNNVLMVDIHQEKTGKDVTIPVTKDYIEKILTKEFPYKISNQRFNDYLKELCQVCEIDEPTKGKLYDKKISRKKLGTYPKYKLITSHSLRRSFASNYYKYIPTPVLMEITGHAKESTFLEYINKPKDKDANANLFLKLVNEMNREKTPHLKKVN
jgi:integrase